MRASVVTAGAVASLSLQYGSASLIEFIWTLTGLAGIYLTYGNLSDSRHYISALRALQGPKADELRRAARVIAMGHYRNEIFRLWGFLVIVGVGIIAMLTPSAAPRAPVNATSVAVTLGLFTLTGLLVTSSFLDRRQREVLINMELDSEEARDDQERSGKSIS